MKLVLITLSSLVIMCSSAWAVATSTIGDTNTNTNINSAGACAGAEADANAFLVSDNNAYASSSSIIHSNDIQGQGQGQYQGMGNSGNQSVNTEYNEERYRNPQSIAYPTTMPATTTITAATPFGSASAGTETFQAKRSITVDKIIAAYNAGLIEKDTAIKLIAESIDTMQDASKKRWGVATLLGKILI